MAGAGFNLNNSNINYISGDSLPTFTFLDGSIVSWAFNGGITIPAANSPVTGVALIEYISSAGNLLSPTGSFDDAQKILTIDPNNVDLSSQNVGLNANTPGIWTMVSAPGYSLSIVNPYALYAPSMSAPAVLDLPTVLRSPTATMLAADGRSAVVLVYESISSEPVTFSVSASGAGVTSGTSVGSIVPFNPNYLVSPNPPVGSAQPPPIQPSNCDQFGNCTFLALLWGPSAMPVADASPPLVNLTVTATQTGIANPPSYNVQLVPPPLLLVHGLWDSAAGAGFAPGTGGFYDWIASQYPHGQIFGVNYGFGPPACLTCTPAIFPFPAELLSAKRFDDAQIQAVFANAVDNALASAANAGLAARTVDVVAHSMGGLVARQYESSSGYSENPALLGNPIRSLITIGTPHLGTNLATTLWNDQGQALVNPNPIVQGFCFLAGGCVSLGEVFDLTGHAVDSAVASLSQSSTQISNLSQSSFDAVVGEAPTNPLSTTESTLNAIIGAFLPNQTVTSILGGQASDTIVPVGSASAGSADCAAVPGIVHAAMGAPDTGETRSGAMWVQAFHWLTGGSGLGSRSIACPTTAISAQSHNVQSHKTAGTKPHPGDIGLSTGSAPNLNLAGYTQVDVSNVAITPASGSALTIGSATIISASSATRTIAEMLLLQGVIDPTDTVLMYATQSPFTITYTPTRLGTASFTAITVFNDNTYALTPLSYSLQAPGPPSALYFLNAPIASLPIGSSTVVETEAQFPSGPADVTNVATYASQSGGSSVFGIGAGGTITANGSGVDQLNVFYGGLTATATIALGACTYALTPSSQIVSYSGGNVTIGVTAPTGCAWTASGGGSWLTFTNASGVGSGAIILTAAANTSGSAQTATIGLANASVLVEQAATACAYGLSQSQISAPPGGISGTINVTTSCPVVASSNASWVMAIASTSSVSYTVTPNTGTSQRKATLTIGTQAIPVVQPAAVTPTVTVTSSASSIATAQSLMVTVAVSGGTGNPTPTGSVTLTGGGYTSSAGTLSSGSYTFAVPANSLTVGTDALTVTYSGDTNYATNTGTASVTVTTSPLIPTVNVTPAANILDSGTALSVKALVAGAGVTPSGTVTLSGGGYTSPAGALSGGSYTFAIPANSLTAGTDTLTVSYSGDPIYTAGTGSASVSVTQSAFSTAASTPPGVNAGSTATSTVTVSSTTAYAGTVTITCALTSSPAGAVHLPTCSNGSSTVTLGGTTTTGTATVTVSTTAPTTAMSRPPLGLGRGLAGAGGGAVLAFLLFLRIPARRRSWQSLIGMRMLVVMVALGTISGCGGGGGGSGAGGGGTTTPGTTAGAYTFTVTGTGSPALTPAPTTTFTLTVN